MRKIGLFMAMALVAGSTAIAEITPADESDAIKKTALDYIEGWYAGDEARMERALHSELAISDENTLTQRFRYYCHLEGPNVPGGARLAQQF